MRHLALEFLNFHATNSRKPQRHNENSIIMTKCLIEKKFTPINLHHKKRKNLGLTGTMGKKNTKLFVLYCS